MILIRKAHPDDYEAIQYLHQELADLHIKGAPWNFTYIQPSYNKKLYKEILEDSNNLFYIAESSDHIVAYAIFQIRHSENYPILKNRSWLFVKDIVVTKNQKGKGIGTLLLEKGEEIAREMETGSLELHVWSFNEEAIEFYRKKGFEPFAIKMRKDLR